MVRDPLDISLSGNERFVLNLVADYQLGHAEPTPVRHVLLVGPPEQADALKATISSLADKGCLERSGFPSNELLHLTCTGLLLSKNGGVGAALAEGLLRYFKGRLTSEGVHFTGFTWDDLKAAGVVQLDEHFTTAVSVIQLLELSGGSGSWSKGPPATGRWGIPDDIAAMRALDGIRDLQMRADRRETERNAASAKLRAKTQTLPLPTKDVKTMVNNNEGEGNVPPVDRKKVFIVYGRNLAAYNAMSLFLRSLSLRSDAFSDDVAAAEDGAPYVGDVLDRSMAVAGAIIVLLTPDEWTSLVPPHSKGATGDEREGFQARPNVIFEAGLALGAHRKKTILVVVGGVHRKISDIAGRHLVMMDNSVPKREALKKRLQMRCDVVEQEGWHATDLGGDFEASVKLPEGSPRAPFPLAE